MDAPASFEFAKEVTTQLIALSSAVVGVSVTFAKDISSNVTRTKRWCLFGAWIAFLSSIVTGILVLGSLAGVLATEDPVKPNSIYKSSITIKSGIQETLFLVGILLLIIDGIQSVRKRI